MPPHLTLTIEGEHAEASAAVVDTLLEEANRALGHARNKQVFCATLRDDHGVIVGGVVGYAFWEWLYVASIVVGAEHRGRGYGRRLLESAEGWAAERGCRNAWLMTMTFQAGDFYERCGYSRFAELPEYPAGASRLFLRKSLVQCSKP